jgi:hypothetical protein
MTNTAEIFEFASAHAGGAACGRTMKEDGGTMDPNLDDLYLVLRGWAQKTPADTTYTALSHAYQARTGDWFEPHGSWDGPLGELNDRLHAIGAPALSVLVVLKATGEPGGNFWGCAPNVPPRPKKDIDRVAEFARICKEVLAYPWPAQLP